MPNAKPIVTHSLPATFLQPDRSPEIANDPAAQALVAHIMIAPRGHRFQAVVSVSDGAVRSTGRVLPRAFDAESTAWNAAIAEANRLLGRLFEERSHELAIERRAVTEATITRLP